MYWDLFFFFQKNQVRCQMYYMHNRELSLMVSAFLCYVHVHKGSYEGKYESIEMITAKSQAGKSWDLSVPV